MPPVLAENSCAVPHCANAGFFHIAYGIVNEIHAEIGVPVGLDVDQLLHVGAVELAHRGDGVAEPVVLSSLSTM
jgi:predicted TIM-barrel enzyme